MDNIRIAVATYTNTLPFLHGLKHANFEQQIELVMDHPRACAEKLISGEVDLGIVPIKTLLELPEYHIVSDYCIGTEGAVDSVFIFSEVPIEEVRVLRLDAQSKTSNGLARILLTYYWKNDVEVVESGDADAYVLIGDRTFGKKAEVPYVYDLGQYWKAYTGLPFAFAVWASSKKLPTSFEIAFNNALADGISKIDDIVRSLPSVRSFNFQKYLTENLSFDLTVEKRTAIERYLELYQGL